MYGRIFESIFDSSIMEEGVHVRYLWHCILVLCNQDGVVDLTREALARRVNIPLTQVNEALECFMAPDPSSRSPLEEGRRLVPIRETNWGWRVVNFEGYRGVRNPTDRKTYMREYMRGRRAAVNSSKPDVSACKQMSTPLAPAAAATDTATEAVTGSTTSKGVAVFAGDPPVVDRNVGENPPTDLFDLSNGSNGNGAETNGHAAKKRGAPSATLEAEIAWRVSRVWEVHLAAWRNYRQDRTGVRPKRDPQPHPTDILKPIRLALLAHDKHLLGPDDRERWERESAVRAAGVGIFHDPFLTAKTGQNDLSSGGTEYLEHWRPWKPQRGKADPVPRFAEIYFNIREVGDAAVRS